MKNIQLTKLKLQNFRNIKNAVYEFGTKNAITGKNQIGKSNTLEAINYLLTDTLLNDCNNLSTIKPLDDTKQEVVVEGTFVDESGVEIVLKKKYGEDWVKTRGTDIKEFKGHYTMLYINDIEYKTLKQYLAEVSDYFDIKLDCIKARVDVLRMLTNPYYLTNLIDWKIFRELIIEIVGDVTTSDVIASDPKYSLIAEDLKMVNDKVDLALKGAGQKVNALNNQIAGLQAIIDDLKSKESVDPIVLNETKLKIEAIDTQLKSLRDGKRENKLAALIMNEIADLKAKYADSMNSDRLAYNQSNSTINDNIIALNKHREEYTNDYQLGQETLYKAKSEHASVASEIHFKEIKKEQLLKEKQELYKEFEETCNLQFVENKDKCPNCGFVLNKEAIEKARNEFEDNRNLKLDNINKYGKSINEQISKVEVELSELMTRDNALKTEISNTENILNVYSDKLKGIASEIEYNQKQINPFECSEQTLSIAKDIEKKQEELAQANVTYSKDTSSLEEQMSILRNSKKPLNDILDKQKYYEMCQKDAANKEIDLMNLENELTKAEEKQILLKNFIKTKLSMLNSNVKKVFPNVEFQLVKENIKAGSWDEVCIPRIIGKSTLFANGSTSEKVLTGIEIIECIKRQLALSDLPILFDEGEALDSYSILKIDSKAQIICAKVDENFTVPTVRELR